jgi:hypothetical protein
MDERSATNLHTFEIKPCEYRQSNKESDFWTKLRFKGVAPVFIAALVFGLLSKESELNSFGLTLYSVLLGMEPSSTIWNHVLFHPILSMLISAQQLLEGSGSLNDMTKETLDQVVGLLAHLVVAGTEQFLEMIGRDAVITMGEICAKLTTGTRPEFDSDNASLADASVVFIGRIAETKLELVLPFFVPALLLRFAASTSSTNAKLESL